MNEITIPPARVRRARTAHRPRPTGGRLTAGQRLYVVIAVVVCTVFMGLGALVAAGVLLLAVLVPPLIPLAVIACSTWLISSVLLAWLLRCYIRLSREQNLERADITV